MKAPSILKDSGSDTFTHSVDGTKSQEASMLATKAVGADNTENAGAKPWTTDELNALTQKVGIESPTATHYPKGKKRH